MKLYSFLVVWLILEIVDAKLYCKTDDDCEHLGDLICVKSKCDWGICGCTRDKAARYLGPEDRYKCIDIKKIGESCTEHGEKGVCAAESSSCVDEKCVCNTGTTEAWGGYKCLPAQDKSNTETCSDAIGRCDESSECQHSSESWWSGKSPLDGVPNVCKCKEGYKTSLPNDWEEDASNFVGVRIPVCTPILVGDYCLRNEDCHSIKNGSSPVTCTDDRCKCGGTDKQDLSGTACGIALTYGVNCETNGTPVTNSVCDGTVGLVCGDVCAPNYNSKDTKTCVCDAGWRDDPGTKTCHTVSERDDCTSDQQCKSLGRDAVCIRKKCYSDASFITASVMTLLMTVIATLQLTS